MNPQMKLIRGWPFQAKLDDLLRAYRAARASCDRDRARLEQQWSEFETEVAAGRAVLYEEDEDGQVTYDYGERFGDENSEIESTLSLVRQAFIISLHHLWEREINKFMKTKKYVPNKAYDALEAEGLKIDRDELERLRLTCNVAKHSGGGSADDLFQSNSEMFNLQDEVEKPAYDNLIVTDADLDSFFACVKASGFQRPSPYRPNLT